MEPNAATPSLEAATLSHLDAAIIVPSYDRTGLTPSIVHIGLGGFHRAHLATYIDELCEAGHRDWSIIGAGVLAGDAAMAEVLAAQDHLYTLITRGRDRTTVQVIASIVGYIHAFADPAPLIARIAHPGTEILSLTVTEGGYPIDDETGAYLRTSPVAGPSSAFGVIAAGLAMRRRETGNPLTVISCDNIVGNGSAARAATMGEAALLGDGLESWIADSVSFPNSMVDRITPATTDADRRWLADTFHLVDRWPVVTEPFRQWVIEDDFAGRRLPLEALDVIVTDDVAPYERMKLRLLNAAHSCLAYLAALAGIERVDQAMAEPWIHRFVVEFLATEARPVLGDVAGVDLDGYCASLIERFSNPQVGDQIGRLCLDGSAKIPKFLLPTVRAQLGAGGPIELSALAVAGWCEYLTGAGAGGHATPAADPLLADAVAHAMQSHADPVAFLRFDAVFGAELGDSRRFADAFVEALGLLRTEGAPSAVATLLERR